MGTTGTKWGVWLVRAVVMLVATTLATGQAVAAPTDYRIGYRVTVKSGGATYVKTLGTMSPRSGSGGHRIICIDSQYEDPASLADPNLNTSPRIAWLMQKYVDTDSNVKAAALAEIVKEELDRSQDWRSLVWKAFKAQYDESAVVDKMASMRAEAAKNAGPYSISPTLTVDKNSGKGSVTVGIRTGAGNYYKGVAITLTLSGEATWDTTGTKVLHLTSDDAVQSPKFTAKSPGKLTVAAETAQALPSTKVKIYPSKSQQDMVGAVFTDSSVSGSAATTWSGAAPSLSSSVGAASYSAPGTALRDQVTVNADSYFAGTKVTVRSKVYGPLAAQPASTSPSAPAGTPVFATVSRTVTLDANGNAVVNFTTDPTVSGGYYAWQESTDKVGALQAASSTYGRASETSSQFEPRLTSTVSQQTAKVGSRISDQVVITGWKPVAGTTNPVTATLTGQLIGPVTPIDNDCKNVRWVDAPIAYTIPAISVSGNKTLSGVGAYTVLQAGCYTYGYTMTGRVGSTTVWTVQHEPGQAAQTTLITPNAGISSQVATVAVMPNGELIDDVPLFGIPAGETVTVHGDLYGPLETMPEETAEVPAGTPKVGSWTQDGTANSDGTIHVRFRSTPVVSTGYYVWVESSDATGLVPALKGTFGRRAETTLVLNPATVTTQISQQSGLIGDTLTDTATVAGVEQLLAFTSDASVTLSGKLIGPKEPVDGSCEGLEWTSADPVAESFSGIDVGQDGDLAGLGTHVVKAAGCYTYSEHMVARVGDDVLFTVDHAPGQTAQTALISPPKLVTTTSAQGGDLGLAVSDSVGVEGLSAGGVDADVRIVAAIFGPLPAVDGSCSAISTESWISAITNDPVGMQVGESEEVGVTGNGIINTSVVPLPKPGCYTWGESMTVDGEVVAVSPPGLASETTLVETPQIVTETSDRMVGENSPVSDVIHLSHLGDHAGVMEARLWGPYILTDEAADCKSITTEQWQERINAGNMTSSDPQMIDVVAAEGEYVTQPVQTSAAGCYTWTERLVLGDSQTPTYVGETAPGLESETTLVITPRLDTVAMKSTEFEGAELVDSITMRGLHNQGATITGAILGPMQPSDGESDCAGVNWTNADVHAKIDPIEVSASGHVDTHPLTARGGPGCYTFVETITPKDDSIEPLTTAAGIPTETVYLKASPPTPGIPTGILGDRGQNVWLMLLGGTVLLAGAVVGLVQWRRRRVL